MNRHDATASSRASRIPKLGARVRKAARHSLRKVVVRRAISGLALAARLAPGSRPERHGIRVHRNLRYRDRRGHEHTLDVFEPEATGRLRPVVFYVHGGGFSMLSKDTHWGMAMAFARRGYLVFNVNYRLAPRHPYPAAVEDVFAAYEWMASSRFRGSNASGPGEPCRAGCAPC